MTSQSQPRIMTATSIEGLRNAAMANVLDPLEQTQKTTNDLLKDVLERLANIEKDLKALRRQQTHVSAPPTTTAQARSASAPVATPPLPGYIQNRVYPTITPYGVDISY
uniref:Uncharacterized protein n=1 Tax=Periplaneta americana aliusvus 1 TaxID=3133547 RepID=A0AAT9JNK8_9VIRU